MRNDFDDMSDDDRDGISSDFAERLSNVVRSSRDAERRQYETTQVSEDMHEVATEFQDISEADEATNIQYRATASDPAFGYIIGMAVAIGLAPLVASGQADLRYTLSWSVLALFGVIAWLFGNMTRIDTEAPEDIIWGIVFGLILGVPLYAFGSQTLATAVDLLFGNLSTGAILAYLVFVIPLSETLFFRGVMQERRQFWMIALMSALWSVVMFFPMLDFSRYAIVAAVIGAVLLMMNLIFSYVRQRNGLAAAWVCQIIANLMIVFLPLITG